MKCLIRRGNNRLYQCSTFIPIPRKRLNRGDFFNLARAGFDVELFEFTGCTQDVTLKTSDEFIIIIDRSRKPAANGTQMPRGKRGVVFCKSMPGAIMPFERVCKRKNLKPTDKIFEKSPRELMNTVLDELNLKFDRDGHIRTSYSLRHSYICLRRHEGADIYQVAKNCRTSIELIEIYYGRHLKNNSDASAVNVRKARPKPVTVRKRASKSTE
jgi:hypothetical protein